MRKQLGLNLRPDMRRALYRMGDYLKEKYAGRSIPDERIWDHGKILD
jgi:hypothetical protein